jgi:RHH-type proline utilization regulon transcriptional repressor/proline dehydrogenase/delta 1-pyrroline-5-carboxylate dehydrogenase
MLSSSPSSPPNPVAPDASAVPDGAFLPPDPALETTVRAIGHRLLDAMERHPAPGIFSTKGAYARLMEWSMRDPAFKAQLFRFVDTLPMLDSSTEIVDHLREYLGDRAVVLHPALKAGLTAASFAPGLVAAAVKSQVTALARQFVAGVGPDDLIEQLRRNARAGLATTIDLLGETVVSEAEADVFLRRNLEVLDAVSAALARDGEPCQSDLSSAGPLPRLNLSVKISALTPDVHPAAPERSLAALQPRLRTLLRRAREVGAFINFDMESYQLKNLTLALFRTLFEDSEFAAAPAAGIALQAYLRDSEADLRELIAWARARSRPITVRLVKGAYWDYETVLAAQRGWPSPVWSEKPETDANFENLSRLLLEHAPVVTAAFATHNVRSCAYAIAQAERLGLDPRAYEFQALYGMADPLKAALIAQGYRVREYCAVGELLPGMAYLVRRLLENTSNEGFLRQQARGEANREQLLAHPVTLLALRARPPATGAPPAGFRNAPNADFSRPGPREALRAALARVGGHPPQRWPLVLGGRAVAPPQFAPSINPARPGQTLGQWACARIQDADTALAAARSAFPAWAGTPAPQRCAVLERAAALMEARRFDLGALLVLESGKPWIEADAEVSEAIDFCRFYAHEMRQLAAPRLTQRVPGEACTIDWLPRGTGVVIAPWNFPLAILCGLTVAPVVAGNTVVMKPAEQTSVIGATFMALLTEAGLPPGVVNLLTGRGEEVGAHLVAHPQVDFVAFTGSRAVGLQIWEAAGRTLPGQRQLKKVVCEMGGKNALIVDTDADLDEAIPAVLYSTFGFGGQKCSALSRLIVLDGIYDRFLDRFLAACASVPVGDPAEPGTVIGPVIDAEAQARLHQAIADGQREARLAWQGRTPAEGFFVPPTVFTDVRPEHRLAREELFGPVLAVLRARDLDEAFAWANDTEYALTAGLFSRRPSALNRARRELLAGNVYLNRSITGAIVERHPFGGFKLSGSGTKAGGRGYLEHFLFPRLVAENTMRRGFTPPEEASSAAEEEAGRS